MLKRALFPSFGSAALPSLASSSGEVSEVGQRSQFSLWRFAKPPCQTFPLRSLLQQQLLCQRFPTAALPLPSAPPATHLPLRTCECQHTASMDQAGLTRRDGKRFSGQQLQRLSLRMGKSLRQQLQKQ